MSILKSGGSPPFSPSPGHVIVGRSWQVLAGPHVGDLPLWLPPTQGIIFFCLVLLNYMTYGLNSCCYILLLTQCFFLVSMQPLVMATFSCVALKAASAAQVGIHYFLTIFAWWWKAPDPGGPKKYWFYGSGSATLTQTFYFFPPQRLSPALVGPLESLYD